MTAPVTAPDTAPADLELPRPPGAVRRFFGAHPLLVDSLVAGVYLVPTLAEGLVEIPGGGQIDLRAAAIDLHRIASDQSVRRRHMEFVHAVIAECREHIALAHQRVA